MWCECGAYSIGWNPIEYEALAIRFEDRARRFEEQFEVMRRLWTERVVTFEGRFHQLHAAGINPRPIQQPIPLWVGASADAAVRRAARIADGFLPLRPLEGGGWDATMDRVWRWLEEFGRPRSAFGIEGRLDAGKGTPDEWRKTYECGVVLAPHTCRFQPPDSRARRPTSIGCGRSAKPSTSNPARGSGRRRQDLCGSSARGRSGPRRQERAVHAR